MDLTLVQVVGATAKPRPVLTSAGHNRLQWPGGPGQLCSARSADGENWAWGDGQTAPARPGRGGFPSRTGGLTSEEPGAGRP